MADLVQENIEYMAEELHHMKETKLFTEKEVKLILAKRKNMEYKVMRLVKERTDYLNYITYEKELLSLIKLRREKFSIIEGKVVIERKIEDRVQHLYINCCKYWPNDASLWLAHIDFCQRFITSDRVSQLFRRMLQVIPDKPNLWVMAAAFEFKLYDSVELARNILQEGIALNKNSLVLWQEYFKLELLYVDMILRRKEAKNLKAELFIPSEVRVMKTLDMDVSEAVLEGAVAEKVYLFARQSLPDRAGMALEMASIANQFPWAAKVEKTIHVDLLTSFPANPLVTETVCLLKIEELRSTDPDFSHDYENVTTFCNQLLKKLLKANQSVSLDFPPLRPVFSSVSAWDTVLNVKFSLENAASTLNCPFNPELEFFDVLDYLSNQGNLSLHWAQKWVDMVGADERTDLLQRLSLFFKTEAEFWVTHLTHLIDSQANTDKITSTFHRARTALQSRNTLPLWKCVVEFLTTSESCSEKQLTRLLELGVVSENEITSYVKAAYMNWSITNCSLQKTRKLFDRLSKLNPVPEEMLVKFIEFEKSQEVPDSHRLREIYEVYTTVHPKTSVDAWSGYTKFERSLGNGMRAAVIHSKAIKQLNADRVDEFMKRQIQPS